MRKRRAAPKFSHPRGPRRGSFRSLGAWRKTTGLGAFNSESHTFLLDGDTLNQRGRADHPAARRMGFGDCTATVWAARV